MAEFDRQLEIQIVKFEEWCSRTESNDLAAFCRENSLGPEMAAALGQFLQMEDWVSSLVADDVESEADDASDHSPEQMIDDYQLVRQLGVGGMGTVWLAHQVHPVKRPVAVKLIRADRDTAVTARRFEREKNALALMSHTHVAKVYDAGRSSEDRPYIAMEFVDGEPITDYCQKRQLSLVDRLELFLQLCSAIQHAHHNGLLHRDIKPGNILVTEDDGKPCVKVIDFGLVRPSDEWDPAITQADMVVGSPLWMSPEQAQGFGFESSKDGAKDAIDTRADIYSLGVVLYQLLTETTPITEEFYSKATKFELIRTIRDEVPELPSSRIGKKPHLGGKDSTPLSGWASVLRNELDWVTMRALEKDRDRRYSTVAAFADDVRNYLNHEPVTARPPSLGYRLRKLAERHKTGALAAVIILGLIVTSSVALAIVAAWAIDQSSLARQAEAEAKEAASLARASEDSALLATSRKENAMSMMAGIIDSLNPSIHGGKFKEDHLRLLDTYRENVDETKDAEDPLQEAEFRKILANAYSGCGEHPSAVEQYERVIEIYENSPNSSPQQFVDSKLGLAEEYILHLNHHLALPQAREAFRDANEFLGETDELTILSRIRLNEASVFNGNLDKVTADLKEVATVSEHELGRDHETTIAAKTALSFALRVSRRNVEAIEQLNEALALAVETFGSNDRRTMDLKVGILECGTLAGTIPDLDQQLSGLLEESESKYGQQHLFTLRLMLKSADLEADTGNFSKGSEILNKLIEDCKQILGPMHPLTLESRKTLGMLHYKWARTNRAGKLTHLKLAREIFEDVVVDFDVLLGPQSIHSIDTNMRIARVLQQRRKYEEAFEIADEYFPLAEKSLGKGAFPTQALAEVRLKCLFELGREEEAIEAGQVAFRKSMEFQSQPSAITAGLAIYLGEANSRSDRHEEACEYFEKAHELFVGLQGEAGRDTQWSLAFLQNELMCLREFAKAEQFARKALASMTPSMPGLSLFKDGAELTLGEALCEQGKFEEGERLLRTAYDRPVFGPEKLLKLRVQSSLALCRIAEGKNEEARQLLEEARSGMNNCRNELKEMVQFRWFVDRCDERLDQIE